MSAAPVAAAAADPVEVKSRVLDLESELAPSATADIGHQLLTDLLHRPANPAGEVVMVRRPTRHVGIDVTLPLQAAGETRAWCLEVRKTVARPSR